MNQTRRPTWQEETLINILIKKAIKKIPPEWKVGLLVEPLKDGGMGSLTLYPHGQIDKNRSFGEQVSEYEFTDKDNVKVIASLNLDKTGNLFKLDIWKTDFSALIELPNIHE